MTTNLKVIAWSTGISFQVAKVALIAATAKYPNLLNICSSEARELRERHEQVFIAKQHPKAVSRDVSDFSDRSV